MVDRIRRMKERQATSLAVHRAPASRAVLGRLVPALAALVIGPLAACGQKGPLYLPSTNAATARPVEHLPSAPDDAMPHGPAMPPSPSTSSPGLPSGVAPAK